MSQSYQAQWSELPALPDRQGFAGMYAGVTSGMLLAMGGANFPDKYPWEGGKKKWYDHIYVMSADGQWRLSAQKLPAPQGYGVSVTYKNRVIVAGGCTESGHLATVFSYEWVDERLVRKNLPDLPAPLAYMAGGLLGNMLVLLGGSEVPAGPPLKQTLVLNLERPDDGWQAVESWPGPERMLPAAGAWEGELFLMGGETTGINGAGEKFRNILHDHYALSLLREGGKWRAQWRTLAPVPRGVSAAGTLPLLNNDRFLIWGGVDAVTAAYKDPASHPGIVRTMLYYFPRHDSWEYLGEQHRYPARVTLAVIPCNDAWLYVSGEIKPGIRTPAIVRVY